MKDEEMSRAVANVESGLQELINARELVRGKEWVERARECRRSGRYVQFVHEFLDHFPGEWERYDERLRSTPSRVRADMNVLLMLARGRQVGGGGGAVAESEEDRAEETGA